MPVREDAATEEKHCNVQKDVLSVNPQRAHRSLSPFVQKIATNHRLEGCQSLKLKPEAGASAPPSPGDSSRPVGDQSLLPCQPAIHTLRAAVPWKVIVKHIKRHFAHRHGRA